MLDLSDDQHCLHSLLKPQGPPGSIGGEIDATFAAASGKKTIPTQTIQAHGLSRGGLYECQSVFMAKGVLIDMSGL